MSQLQQQHSANEQYGNSIQLEMLKYTCNDQFNWIPKMVNPKIEFTSEERHKGWVFMLYSLEVCSGCWLGVVWSGIDNKVVFLCVYVVEMLIESN